MSLMCAPRHTHRIFIAISIVLGLPIVAAAALVHVTAAPVIAGPTAAALKVTAGEKGICLRRVFHNSALRFALCTTSDAQSPVDLTGHIRYHHGSRAAHVLVRTPPQARKASFSALP